MIDVTSLSAYELSQKLHSGEISSVDLCTAYLDRIIKFEKPSSISFETYWYNI